EIGKIAITKLAELRPDDVAKAARTLGLAAGKGSLLVPGLGALGVGILIGTGIGYLTAPRAGNETRARLMEGMRNKLSALTKRTRDREPLPASEEALGSSNGA